jgi:hypothetical protein
MREAGASLMNVPTEPPSPQIGPLGALSAYRRKKKREGERMFAEERQRKLDEKQQLQMARNRSTYGSQFDPGRPTHVTPLDSGDDTSQDSDSHEEGDKSSFAPSRQGLVQLQAQQATNQATVYSPGKSIGVDEKGQGKARQDRWVESSSWALVDTATSVSKSGTLLACLCCLVRNTDCFLILLLSQLQNSSLWTFDQTCIYSA